MLGGVRAPAVVVASLWLPAGGTLSSVRPAGNTLPPRSCAKVPMADDRRRRIVCHMWGWVWIAALYVLGMGFFHWLGGIGAAADALERWGHAVGVRRRRASSPGSG